MRMGKRFYQLFINFKIQLPYKSVFVLIGVVLLLCSACVKKKDINFTITAETVCDNDPLEDVKIKLLSTTLPSLSQKTNSEGICNFPGLLEGVYKVEPVKEGYTFLPRSRTVLVDRSSIARCTFNASKVWLMNEGGYTNEIAYDTKQTSDRGYIVTGCAVGVDGYTDIYIAKLNSFGNIVLNPTPIDIYGEDDIAYAVQVTTDGGYIVAGTAMYESNKSDVFVIKFNHLLNEQWRRIYTKAEHKEIAHAIVETSPGHYMVAGYSQHYSSHVSDILVLSVYEDRDIEPGDESTYSIHDFDFGYDIKQTSDSGYIITGTTENRIPTYSSNMVVLKIDAAKNMEWFRSEDYNFSEIDSAHSVAELSDGYIVAGYSETTLPGDFDMRLVKINNNGTIDWTRTYGTSDSDRAYSIIATNDGGYAVGGFIWSDETCSLDFCLLKLDADGEEQWSAIYNGEASGDDKAYSVVQTIDGGYALGGSSEVGISTSDILILKVDPNGNIR